MKKKLCLSTTLLFLFSLVGSAQSMVVVEKDGKQHKFNTNYIQEVIFEEEESIIFFSLTPSVYSNGNVELEFATEDGSVTAKLDTYGLTDATFLRAGVYTGGSNERPYFDLGSYTYVQINGTKHSVKSGKMTVEKDGKNYTILLDLVLDDDSPLKGRYVGGVKNYDGFLSFVPTIARYFENDYPEGDIMVKMNDEENWSFESSFYFHTTATDRILPVGIYTYSESGTAGTFGASSSISSYSPSANYKFVEGSTITVEKEGETYTFDMHLISTTGADITLTYTGTIASSN